MVWISHTYNPIFILKEVRLTEPTIVSYFRLLEGQPVSQSVFRKDNFIIYSYSAMLYEDYRQARNGKYVHDIIWCAVYYFYFCDFRVIRRRRRRRVSQVSAIYIANQFVAIRLYYVLYVCEEYCYCLTKEKCRLRMCVGVVLS